MSDRNELPGSDGTSDIDFSLKELQDVLENVLAELMINPEDALKLDLNLGESQTRILDTTDSVELEDLDDDSELISRALSKVGGFKFSSEELGKKDVIVEKKELKVFSQRNKLEKDSLPSKNFEKVSLEKKEKAIETQSISSKFQETRKPEIGLYASVETEEGISDECEESNINQILEELCMVRRRPPDQKSTLGFEKFPDRKDDSIPFLETKVKRKEELSGKGKFGESKLHCSSTAEGNKTPEVTSGRQNIQDRYFPSFETFKSNNFQERVKLRCKETEDSKARSSNDNLPQKSSVKLIIKISKKPSLFRRRIKRISPTNSHCCFNCCLADFCKQLRRELKNYVNYLIEDTAGEIYPEELVARVQECLKGAMECVESGEKTCENSGPIPQNSSLVPLKCCSSCKCSCTSSEAKKYSGSPKPSIERITKILHKNKLPQLPFSCMPNQDDDMTAMEMVESRKSILEKCADILEKIQLLETLKECSSKTHSEHLSNVEVCFTHKEEFKRKHSQEIGKIPSSNKTEFEKKDNHFEHINDPLLVKSSETDIKTKQNDSILLEDIERIQGIVSETMPIKLQGQQDINLNESTQNSTKQTVKGPNPEKPEELRFRGGKEIMQKDSFPCCKRRPSNCFCSGNPSVLWAVTKISIFPDDARTYEVMKVSKQKPCKVSNVIDSVFVLIPPTKNVHT